MIPGTVSLKDYDFKKPLTNLYATLPSDEKGEDYDYPGIYTTKAQGDHYARIRLEEREVRIVTVRGSSSCMGFECGYKFTLQDTSAIAPTATTRWWELTIPDETPVTGQAWWRLLSTRMTFKAMPADVPYRPPRNSRKPRIHGTQTAVVVGKSGEEIWTDNYGRVTVQFYWDREGVADEKSSCWIRVAHGWAGKQWGAILHSQNRS